MPIIVEQNYLDFKRDSTTTPGSDTLMDLLLPAVTEGIERYCDRQLEAANYKQWHDGSGTMALAVKEWPINNIYQVSLDTETVSDISYSGTSRHASVQFDGATFTLIDFATDGSQNTSTATVAANPTMTELKASIDAVAGWSMSVQSGYGNDPSSFVKPVLSAYANDGAQMVLEYPRYGVSVELRHNTDRQIQFATGDVINTPFASRNFHKGFNNIFVWYNAGYTYPTDVAPSGGNVPSDLTLAACQIVDDLVATSTGAAGVGHVTEKKLADWSEKYNLDAISNAVQARSEMLDPYKRFNWM
jgi:hypothetical protein